MSDKIKTLADNLVQNIAQVLIGKNPQILQTLTCLVAGGHLLLEDLPGLGKTTLAKALAASFGVSFRRIQCTPDVMPSDITGVSIFNQQTQAFEFIAGPVFTQVLLADEINRTSPRTQSALLEAMAEGTVTVDRQTYTLTPPFFVIATQNPIEFAGTYPLPEAQMDRFMMRISLGYPDPDSEVRMLQSHQRSEQLPQVRALMSAEQLLLLRRHAERVAVSPALLRYITDLVGATRSHAELQLSASPRASLALLKAGQAMSLLSGQDTLRPATVQALARPVLQHRLLFRNRSAGEAEISAFFASLLQSVRLPDHPGA